MTTVTLGILTGLGAAIGFGAGDFLAAKASKAYGAARAAFWTQAGQWLAYMMLFLAMGWELHLTAPVLAIAVLEGLLFMIGLIYIWRAFVFGPVSIVSAFMSTYALVAALVSALVLGDTLTLTQWAIVLILLSGAALASIDPKTKLPSGGFWRQPGIRYGLIGAVSLGLSFVCIAAMAKEVGWQSSFALMGASNSVWAAALLKLRKQPFLLPRNPGSRSSLYLLVATGLFLVTGGLMTNIGFDISIVGIVAPIGAASPLITGGLALAILKERPHRYQLAGSAVVIIGLILLAMQ